MSCLHVSADVFSTAVHPYNCIMQGLAADFVPDNGGFPLVCDAKSFDFKFSIFLLCCFDSLLYARLNTLPYFLRVVLYPAIRSRQI